MPTYSSRTSTTSQSESEESACDSHWSSSHARSNSEMQERIEELQNIGTTGFGLSQQAQTESPNLGNDSFVYPDAANLTPEWVEEHRDRLGMPEDVPVEHFFLEYVAKTAAYRRGEDGDAVGDAADDFGLTEEDRLIFENFGYDPDTVEWLSGEDGMQAMMIRPSTNNAMEQSDGSWVLPDGSTLPAPIMAFRGTEIADETKDDLLTDFHPHQVGTSQYLRNQEMIDDAFSRLHEEFGDITVTGHSLGGALSGLATAMNVDTVGEWVGFNPAGVDATTAAIVASQELPVTNYMVDNDIVSTAGERAMPGDTHLYDAADESLGFHPHLQMLWAPKTDEDGAHLSNDRSWMNWNTGFGDLIESGGETVACRNNTGFETHEYEAGTNNHDPYSSVRRAAREFGRQGILNWVFGETAFATENAEEDVMTALLNEQYERLNPTVVADVEEETATPVPVPVPTPTPTGTPTATG